MLLLVTGAVAIAAGRERVTITDDALVLITPLRSLTIAWPDIVSIAAVSNRVVVTTSRGSHAAPLWAGSPVVTRAPTIEPRNLLAALNDRWVACRGTSWTPRPPDPWVPTRDRHGRVVMRLAWRRRVDFVTRAAGIMAIWLVVPPTGHGALSSSLGGLAIIVGVVLATQWWTRVTIGPDEIEIRSWRVGIRRIPRSWVHTVQIQSLPMPWGGHRHHLILVTGNGPISLPAPVTQVLADQDDPDFYRIHLWLLRELADPGSFGRPPTPPMAAEPTPAPVRSPVTERDWP